LQSEIRAHKNLYELTTKDHTERTLIYVADMASDGTDQQPPTSTFNSRRPLRSRKYPQLIDEGKTTSE
jgi:hypothetical protein